MKLWDETRYRIKWGDAMRFRDKEDASDVLEEIIQLMEEKEYGEAHQGVRVLYRNLNDLINRMAEQDEQVLTQRKRIKPINWGQNFKNRRDAEKLLKEILDLTDEREYLAAAERVRLLYQSLHDLISRAEEQDRLETKQTEE